MAQEAGGTRADWTRQAGSSHELAAPNHNIEIKLHEFRVSAAHNTSQKVSCDGFLNLPAAHTATMLAIHLLCGSAESHLLGGRQKAQQSKFWAQGQEPQFFHS